MNITVNTQNIKEELFLEDLSEFDDLEELVYTVIDACPYDFEFIPTIASFRYLTNFDQIAELNGIRYFYKMYKLIDLLCFYKALIQKYEKQTNQTNNKISNSTQLTLVFDDNHLFESCQISAIKIYKEYFFTHKNKKLDNKLLAYSLNHIINEFFEESYTSKLKEKDINKAIKVRANFMGIDIFTFENE